MYVQLTIAYLGTHFKGFQLQIKERTVAGEIAKTLGLIFKTPVRFVSAGRTDAGVHACGQVISFLLPFPIELAALNKALHSLLPPDIQVVSLHYHNLAFHALRDAKLRIYKYYFTAQKVPVNLYSHIAEYKLRDFDTLAKTLSLFEGSYEYKAFSKFNPSLKPGPRTVSCCELSQSKLSNFMAPASPLDLFCITVKANAFLHHMIRHIVGASFAVDQGRLTQADIYHMLCKNNKVKTWSLAPAKGLWLHQVEYNYGELNERKNA